MTNYVPNDQPDISRLVSPEAIALSQMYETRNRAQMQQQPTSKQGGWNRGGWGGGGGSPVSGGAASDGSQNGSPMFDLFGTSAAYIAQRQPSAQNYMTSYYIKEYNAIRGDLWFYDFSGGIDAQIRRIADGVISNELAYSSASASHARTLNLPPLLTADATAANEIGTLEAMSFCELNDGGTYRWVVAAGDTANKCLFTLGTTLTAQTYTPSSNIVSLTTVKIATNTERVIVGRAGGAAQVLTGFDGTPTTSGTMHANTTGCWGVIRTTLNSTTPGAENLLIYSNDSLYILSSTAAIGDAPTAVLTNWPGGGYALGIATASTDGVARAYWMHPLNDLSASMLDTGAPGKIVSTNLEGLDPKVVNIGLPFVRHALIWRNGIVATDGKQVKWLTPDGDIVNLGWNRERKWRDTGSADGFGTVQSLAVIEDQLLVCTAAITGDVNDIVNPTVWEEYIPENNTWQFFATAVPSAGLLTNIAMTTGKTPVYRPHDTAADAGNLWWYVGIGGGLIAATYQWEQCPLLPSGVNPQWQQSEAVRLFYKFATLGYVITPEYHYLGLPMYVSDIQFMGTIKGEDAKVEIEQAAQGAAIMYFADEQTVADSQPQPPATFKEDTDWKKHWYVNPNPEASKADRLQFKITVTQGTSGTYVAKSSPNALPIRIGFYCFLDGKYTDPKVMEPQRYWGGLE